jgi:hypothetical protein
MPNFNDFVYFVLVRNGNASYSFTGYTDQTTGETKVIHYGRKDHLGNDVPHRFKFDKAHRSLRVPKNKKDIHGNSVVEFLRGFPECLNSPNGYYKEVEGEKKHINMWFKEMNEGKDAEIAIDAKRVKINAESTALNLEGDELAEMAILCGTMTEDEGIQKHRVLEYAGASPEKFMEMYNQPDRQATTLLKRAVHAGLVSQKGTMFIWEEITIGANESLAVSKLVEDTTLMDAIAQNLTALGA